MRAPVRLRHPAVRSVLTLTLAVLLPLLVVACEVETDPEVEAELEEAQGELEEAGAELAQSLEAAGEEASREARKAGERLKPMVADAELTARVKTRLTAHPDINPLYVDVDTIDGTVTLTGKVPTEEYRDRVVETARNTEGVGEVIDHLQIGPRG